MLILDHSGDGLTARLDHQITPFGGLVVPPHALSGCLVYDPRRRLARLQRVTRAVRRGAQVARTGAPPSSILASRAVIYLGLYMPRPSLNLRDRCLMPVLNRMVKPAHA